MVKQDLSGLDILITSGPTQEAIDPVRYISNHSSGKMGYALAYEALKRNANVKVISGPVSLSYPSKANVVQVISALEMYNEVMSSYKDFDIIIMAAAVADYRCANIRDQKIKKNNESLVLELVKNPDIAKEIGKIKENRLLIGFSAETNDVILNATGKLNSKNMDMIIANDVTVENSGFGSNNNIITILRKDKCIKYPLLTKKEVSKYIIDEIMDLFFKR